MAKALDENLSLLKRLIVSDPLLSADAIEAIAMAVRVVSVVEFADIKNCRIEMIDSNKIGKVLTLETLTDDGLSIGYGREFRGDTWMECFSAAGRQVVSGS